MSQKLALKPNQAQAFERIKDFIRNSSGKVFILKGYAGTGKTTMMKVLIEELTRRNLPYSLMASTGRAAKILSNATHEKTSTIHGEIYTYKDLNQDLESVVSSRAGAGVDKTGQLLLIFERTVINNDDYDCHYYIIDEASMISDKEDEKATQAMFGTGKLLEDLFYYDSKGKFVFVGDICQLPPVLQDFSPALNKDYIQKTYCVEVDEVELTEIIRQDSGNDLILSSKRIRQLYADPPMVKWGKFPFKGYNHINLYASQSSLLEAYIDKIKRNGYNDATLICCSNKSCLNMTNLIRPALGHRDHQLEVGDLLLVTQNNYTSGLMNGDMVRLNKIGVKEQLAGLTFIYVEVVELFTEKCYAQLMIEEVVYHIATNLSQFQQKELFVDFFLRMKKRNIKQKSKAFQLMMMTDPYLNALRVVYGYALTCHKAQGGEWNDVFLDIPRNFPLNPKRETYQWIYTAMTRAKTQLHIVNDFWVG